MAKVQLYDLYTRTLKDDAKKLF